MNVHSLSNRRFSSWSDGGALSPSKRSAINWSLYADRAASRQQDKRRFVNRRALMSSQGVTLSQEIRTRFPPTRRYLIGVSGGRDSVALLHGLTSLGYKRLIVCHLDHRLRGRASATDARF